MSNEIKVDEMVTEVTETASSMVEAMRKVMMAGVGAMVLASESAEKQINKFMDDAETFINKMIERGEIAEKDGRKLFADMVEKRSATVQELREKAAERGNLTLNLNFDEFVSRFNVPSKDDIEALTKKIGTLSRKVDQLRRSQAKAAETKTIPVVDTAVEAEPQVSA